MWGKGLQPADYWTAKSAVLLAKTAALADMNSKRAARRTDLLILLFVVLTVLTLGLMLL
jgi:hypothetical protein